MYVYAKGSGELLSREPDKLWTADGLNASAEKINGAYRQRSRLGIDGLTVISGGGNFPRGDKLRAMGLAKGIEDVLARLALMQNTLILASALKVVRIPHRVFLANTMGFRDATIGTMEPYDIEAERQAHDAEEVVLIAGGTGEDGKTTDNAIVHYASGHLKQWREEQVVVLKGTKLDGVFTNDPKLRADARRYTSISAGYMLEHFDTHSAVDKPCLGLIQRSRIPMRVYQDGAHDMASALAIDSAVGTLITPGNTVPILAD